MNWAFGPGFAACLFLAAAILPARADDGLLNSFESPADFSKFTANNCTAAPADRGVTEGRQSALVVFGRADWPNIYFKAGTAFTNGDWRASGGLAVDVLNTNAAAVRLTLRVDDDLSADGVKHCRAGYCEVPPGRTVSVVMPFVPAAATGMVGSPPMLPNAVAMTAYGATLDWSHIAAFQFFLTRPASPTALFFDNLRLVRTRALTNLADKYGQYTGADWPGKIHQDGDFTSQNNAEQDWLAAHPKPADRDIYGGWQDGPQLKATGFFRTAFVWTHPRTASDERQPAADGVRPSPGAAAHERTAALDFSESDGSSNVAAPEDGRTPGAGPGRWWLVDPAGRLFFSLGVDVVDYGEGTTVAGREPMFGWLPDAGDPLAEFSPPGAKRTANFHRMNLWRKYGTNWNSQARARIFERLDAWGFNTLGDWSAADLYGAHRVPYTVPVWYDRTGLATFKSAAQTMVDVYDPSFAARVAKGMSMATASWKSDPWCLGYFAENELPWAGWGEGTKEHYALPVGVLVHDGPLPAKGAFAGLLQNKYPAIEQLNAAWNTSVSSWNSFSNQPVTLPADWTPACSADLGAFLKDFAGRYFSTIGAGLKREAPNQLFLGGKFASHPEEAVAASAQYCDVVSFDIYERSLDTNKWAFTRALNKPCLSAEFHIGALDSGMFHPGLVRAADQADRGRAYQEYVRSVCALPAFVGCHWFEYHDEPLTGRSYDGENYNIGMVSGTDTPYGELTAAAREVNEDVYKTIERLLTTIPDWHPSH